MKRLLATAVLVLSCGCVQFKTESIVAVKVTTFGLNLGVDPATRTPTVQLGLHRIFYQRIPVSTNGPVFAPRYTNYVHAEIGLTKQTVEERVETSE